MIIYEVNLEIANEIYKHYTAWLTSHVSEMLNFQGFQKALILEETAQDGVGQDYRKLTVQYHVSTLDALQNYLNGPATLMRQDGTKKFAGKFNATRRILKVLN